MRVLITGGAGFIGSHLCRRLLDEGCEVLAYDNLLTGAIENIESLLGHPQFEFQHYDVTNFLYVAGDLDAILHFASPASPADFERLPIQILKVGSLDDPSVFGTPQMAIFTCDKQSFHTVPEGVPEHDKVPG